MTYNWLLTVLVIDGVFAAAGLAALCLVGSTRRRMRRQQKCHLAESQSLRETNGALQDAVAVLRDQVQKACMEMKQDSLRPVASPSFTGLSAHKRAEALRMYRHGSDCQTVSTALDLKPAEVALLEKVHILTATAA